MAKASSWLPRPILCKHCAGGIYRPSIQGCPMQRLLVAQSFGAQCASDSAPQSSRTYFSTANRVRTIRLASDETNPKPNHHAAILYRVIAAVSPRSIRTARCPIIQASSAGRFVGFVPPSRIRLRGSWPHQGIKPNRWKYRLCDVLPDAPQHRKNRSELIPRHKPIQEPES
jgi:hypothetical protein